MNLEVVCGKVRKVRLVPNSPNKTTYKSIFLYISFVESTKLEALLPLPRFNYTIPIVFNAIYLTVRTVQTFKPNLLLPPFVTLGWSCCYCCYDKEMLWQRNVTTKYSIGFLWKLLWRRGCCDNEMFWQGNVWTRKCLNQEMSEKEMLSRLFSWFLLEHRCSLSQ